MNNKILEVIDIIENSDYYDPIGHFDDGIKCMRRSIRLNERIDTMLYDFIKTCENSIFISYDGKIDKCIKHLKLLSRYYKIEKIIKKNKKI